VQPEEQPSLKLPESLLGVDLERPVPGFLVGILAVQPISETQLRQISPAALAYLGDAVYELYVRTSCLIPPKRLQAYHNQVVDRVRAESQAQHLRSLRPYLTPQELDIIRRGRNAASKRPKRVAAAIYQQASSLESLLGYLYLANPQRLVVLLAQLDLDVS